MHDYTPRTPIQSIYTFYPYMYADPYILGLYLNGSFVEADCKPTSLIKIVPS